MTKTVRIENADTSDYTVIVEVWDKGYPSGSPDTLVKTIELSYPTAMTDSSIYITSTRYLVIREKKKQLDLTILICH
jgi:hypothetical protein